MKIIHLFWAGARELSSSWLLATCGSLFSSWFRLLFRFFRCHFLRSSFWLCLLFWRWSILGFNISIINLILRIVLIVVVVKMTAPSTVCHGHVTLTTFESQAIFLIEHLASDIWALRFRVRFFSTSPALRALPALPALAVSMAATVLSTASHCARFFVGVYANRTFSALA